MGLKSVKRRHRMRSQPTGSIRKAKKTGRKTMVTKNQIWREVADRWDKSKSLHQNFKELGLRLDPNKGSSEKAENPVELNVPNPAPPKEARLSHEEINCVKRLIEKHGTNYKAMERDIKINVYQNTKKQLKKKCEVYLSKYVPMFEENLRKEIEAEEAAENTENMEEGNEEDNDNNEEVAAPQIKMEPESDNEDNADNNDDDEVQEEEPVLLKRKKRPASSKLRKLSFKKKASLKKL